MILQQSLLRVPWIHDTCSKTVLKDMVNLIQFKLFEPMEILVEEDNYVTEIFIIETGCLEVSVRFDGNIFKLEHLGKGSIINHN